MKTSAYRFLASWLLAGFVTTCFLIFGPVRGDDAPYSVLVNPDNSLCFQVLKDDKSILSFDLINWGPKWGWAGPPTSHEVGTGGKLAATGKFSVGKQPTQSFDVSLAAQAASATSVSYQYTLNATADVPLTMLALAAAIPPGAEPTGTITCTAGGQAVDMAIPILRATDLEGVSQAIFHLPSGDITVQFNPPISVGRENGALRFKLGADVVKTGQTVIGITVSFPSGVKFLSSAEDIAKYVKTVPQPDWFTLSPTLTGTSTGTSIFGMEGWLDAPAGKHGGVRMDKDFFKFEDGTPVKFWGTNLAYADCAPPKEVADALAAKFARYGVNSVRLHKFTGVGWAGFGDPNDATKFEPQGMDRFDYFTSQLAAHGTYYGFSHTFGFRVRPANKDKVLAYDEIMKADKGGNTYGLINVAEDVQDLMIASVVNLLQHQNPYTKKTYAVDPALAYIELQNEDDIMFYTTSGIPQKYPTYAKKLTEQYADWLKTRYGSQEKLAAAWGDALKAGQTLEAKNIPLEFNPWAWGSDNLPKQTGGAKVRLLDNALFFHVIQDKFYAKFVKAIRDAGYKGPLVGSPWQAPAMLPHYYNLLSDYQVGYIDRHDYFGGKPDDNMLANPGSGYLSTGLQQVADRPFGISEWITCYPTLYSPDGAVMLAAYGMGLQGWSASYEFTSKTEKGDVYTPALGFTWDVDVPNQLGIYPALSRMIMRRDVKTADIISTRSICIPDMEQGNFDFTDKVVLQGDVKTFGGSVPAEALAAGRCVLQFTQKAQASTFPDMTKYKSGSVITSSTGQLKWDSAGKGYFTINTDGTKAVAGFAAEKVSKLGDVTITPHSPYAVILLTALDKGKTLANDSSALLIAAARVANTDYSYNVLTGKTIEKGKGPVMVEPVAVDIAVAGRPVKAVKVLDADGKDTGQTVPVSKGAFKINTARDKTIYYQIVY